MPARRFDPRLPLVLLLAVGCGRAAPPTPPAAATPAAHGHGHGHEDHDHPETLAEGVTQLAQAAAAIATHCEAGARDAADDAVHGVVHIIEDVQALVPKETLSAEGKAAASTALDELFDCFEKLDAALHAPAGSGESLQEVHAGVKARIEAALDSLRNAR